MPRPNQPRRLGAEAALARRIAWERDKRGWSNEQLARRMTDRGCAIQASAIYKIEKADPPRRIAVDELVALALVFETSVGDLLQAPNTLVDAEVSDVLRRASAAQETVEACVAEMRELLAVAPEKRGALKWTLGELFPDWPEITRLFRPLTRPTVGGGAA